jgi:hypothetical protein
MFRINKGASVLFAVTLWAGLAAQSEAQESVTGLNVKLVLTNKTRWHVSAPGTWVEDGAAGSANYFKELKREKNAVYLSDESRHLEIQINLENGHVWWAGGATHAGWTQLYNITHAEAR